MTQIGFVQRDGAENGIEIGSGEGVMLAVLRNGIDGECGGCLDCATSHVDVDEVQVDCIPLRQPDELELPGPAAATRRSSSLLSRQLKPPFPAAPLTDDIPGNRS
jgi:2Fe-2S ferredoxin